MKSGLRRYVNGTRLAVLGLICVAGGCTAQHAQKTAAAAQAPDAKAPDTAAILALKMRCAEFGKRYADDLEKVEVKVGYSPINPRFAYNPELNTCLVRAGDISRDGNYKFIADALTGETLLEMFGNDPGKQAEFNQSETRLMGSSETDLIGRRSKPK